jgi:hypothetical protein
MTGIAKARTDPADLINAAIDALIRNRFEIPALDTLLRTAATAHSTVNAAQWTQVYGQLNGKLQQLQYVGTRMPSLIGRRS